MLLASEEVDGRQSDHVFKLDELVDIVVVVVVFIVADIAFDSLFLLI
jgi:hypothetical protein